MCLTIIIWTGLFMGAAMAGEPTDMDKEEAKAFLGLAQTALDKGDPAKATEWVTKADAKAPSGDAEYLKGLILEKTRAADAQAQFEKVLTCKLFLDSKVVDKTRAKIETIRLATEEFRNQKQKYVEYLKRANAYSDDPYVKALTTAELRKISSESLPKVNDLFSDTKKPEPAAPAPATPRVEPTSGTSIVGTWKYPWGTLTFRDDKTCHSTSRNTSGSWTILDGRTVKVTWSSGFVDVLAPTEDANVWKGKNTLPNGAKGPDFDMTRIAQ